MWVYDVEIPCTLLGGANDPLYTRSSAFRTRRFVAAAAAAVAGPVLVLGSPEEVVLVTGTVEPRCASSTPSLSAPQAPGSALTIAERAKTGQRWRRRKR